MGAVGETTTNEAADLVSLPDAGDEPGWKDNGSKTRLIVSLQPGGGRLVLFSAHSPYVPYCPYAAADHEDKQRRSRRGLIYYTAQPNIPPGTMHMLSDGTTIPEYRWQNRHWLFQLFDRGVQVDGDGFMDITPEPVAEYISRRMRTLTSPEVLQLRDFVIIEGCSGYGGNTIQLARCFPLVIGVEKDAFRLTKARANVEVYNTTFDCKVAFIKSGFTNFCAQMRMSIDNNERICALSDFKSFLDLNRYTLADCETKAFVPWAFFSPPWGGENYKNAKPFRMRDVQVARVINFMKAASRIAENVAVYLPPNQSLGEIAELAQSFANCALVLVDRITVGLTLQPKYCVVYFLSGPTVDQASTAVDAAPRAMNAFVAGQSVPSGNLLAQLGPAVAREICRRLGENEKELGRWFIETQTLVGSVRMIEMASTALQTPLTTRTVGGEYFQLMKQRFPEEHKILNRRRKAVARESMSSKRKVQPLPATEKVNDSIAHLSPKIEEPAPEAPISAEVDDPQSTGWNNSVGIDGIS